MKFTRFLSSEEKRQLEFETVSGELRVYLTRMLEDAALGTGGPSSLIHLNRIVNWSRRLTGLWVYVLTPDDWGDYQPYDFGWHYGEIQLVFHRLSTLQFIEFLCEVVRSGYLEVEEANDALEEDDVSFRIKKNGVDDSVTVDVIPLIQLESLEEEKEDDEAHPNIRVLVSRMDTCLLNNDVGGVLHSAASIFETLAKDVVAIEGVQDQTLASFFARYRKDSLLPEPFLDYVLDIYKSRNAVPLAGHGSIKKCELSPQQATILAEITKAFVKIEYKLRPEFPVERDGVNPIGFRGLDSKSAENSRASADLASADSSERKAKALRAPEANVGKKKQI